MRKLFIFFGFCLVFVAGFGRRQRHFEASGRVRCCYRRTPNSVEKINGFNSLCQIPTRAKIELYDYYYLWTDELLSTVNLEGRPEYNLEWEGMRFFNIYPYLILHLECQDGRIIEKRVDIFEENLTTVDQIFDIDVSRKL